VRRRKLAGALALLTLAGITRAQQTAKAAITASPVVSIPLFTIDWNITANVVHYDARLKDGKFDPKEPVVAYWVMNQTDGHHEGLTLIEKLKAYGFTVRPGNSPDTYDMTIVSVKHKPIHLSLADGHVRMTMTIGNCEAYLNHVHVQAHKWHMLNIADYAEVIGTDIATGAECRERVMARER
jgi:DMSO/TMAO reductase YedYZ molybdopterin-dependent catalytic subunit